MFQSFQVGASFQIINRASPVLATLTREIRALKVETQAAHAALVEIGKGVNIGNLSRRLATLNDNLAKTAAVSAEIRGSLASDFDAVGAGLMIAARNARELAAAMGEVGIAQRAITAGAAVGAGGGRGGGRGGLASLSARAPIGGGMHLSSHAGTGVMAVGGALGYGAYMQAEAEDAAVRTLLTSQQPINARNIGMVRGVIQGGMTTGYGAADVEKSILTGARQFQGTPFDQVMSQMPAVLSAAAREARMKDTSLEEATRSLIGLMHMTKTYDPAKFPGLAEKFAFVSTVSPLSLGQIEKAASYAVPTLQEGLGLDPGMLLLLGAAQQRAGITSSKAGTWTRGFFARSFTDTATMPAGLVSILGGSAAHSDKHTEALKKLGMADPKKWLDWDDQIQMLINMSEIMSAHLAKMPRQDRLSTLMNAYGAQASGTAAFIADPIFMQQLKQLHEQMVTTPNAESFWSQYNHSPVQQVRSSLQELSKVLMDLGVTVLPPLVNVLKDFAAAATVINNSLGSERFAHLLEIITAAGIGAKVAGPAGALIGAGGAALFLGPGPSKGNAPGDYARAHPNEHLLPPVISHGGSSILSPMPSASDPSFHHSAFVTGGVAGGITVNVYGGDSHDVGERVVAAINKAIGRSMLSNQGDGDGTMHSAYATGTGI